MCVDGGITAIRSRRKVREASDVWHDVYVSPKNQITVSCTAFDGRAFWGAGASVFDVGINGPEQRRLGSTPRA
jgi:hypothetical protein